MGRVGRGGGRREFIFSGIRERERVGDKSKDGTLKIKYKIW